MVSLWFSLILGKFFFKSRIGNHRCGTDVPFGEEEIEANRHVSVGLITSAASARIAPQANTLEEPAAQHMLAV